MIQKQMMMICSLFLAAIAIILATDVSSAGNLQRELWELRTSSLDLQDVGRDFSFSLCAVPLSDSCPKILEQGRWRSEIRGLE